MSASSDAVRESDQGILTQGKGRRRLIVLTGPTAVGKGTVEAALRAAHPQIWVSVSATTRAPRPGESNGITYWFMDEEEFARKDKAGDFLESALVHGMSHYATPLKPVLEHMEAGVPTILEIDLQGAQRVRQRAEELGLDVVYVFLAPPTFDDLVIRLNKRGTENEEQRKKRLETAKVELAAKDQFDVVVVNDSVEKASDALWQIISREYDLPA